MKTTLDTIDRALAYLPPQMSSLRARAMLLAIGMQESRLTHRKQIGGGPARGLWQFERGGGVAGVLRHHLTQGHAATVCWRLGNAGTTSSVYHALEHNDVLAACFARLLLWTLPGALPVRGQAEEGWRQYIAAWRPGKPHRHTWDEFYEEAWATVLGER